MNKKQFNPIAEIFKHLTISLIFALAGYTVAQQFIPIYIISIADTLIFGFIIALLILALISKKGVLPTRFSMNYVYLFAFLEGITLYPIFIVYLYELGVNTVLFVIIGTIAIFATLTAIASKKEAGHYLKFGPALYASLIVLIILSFLGFFITSNFYNMMVSIAGIIIFSLYILYDISLIKKRIELNELKDTKDLSIHVLNLFLDFVDILLDILHLIASASDN